MYWGWITFTWDSGRYNIYRAVDDPYASNGTQIGTRVNSGWNYAEPLLGNTSQNAYYLVGATAACGQRVGVFDYPITAGS